MPPVERPEGNSAGWVERIDPVTLETLIRSPPLRSGGHLWCGAMVCALSSLLSPFCHTLLSFTV